jgi:hypothetical protein
MMYTFRIGIKYNKVVRTNRVCTFGYIVCTTSTLVARVYFVIILLRTVLENVQCKEK